MLFYIEFGSGSGYQSHADYWILAPDLDEAIILAIKRIEKDYPRKDTDRWFVIDAKVKRRPRGRVERGENMDEHKHEWRILLVMPNSATAQIKIRCRVCNDALLRQEAERHLSAIEALKEFVADLMDANDGPNDMGGPFVQLSLIADILEGK